MSGTARVKAAVNAQYVAKGHACFVVTTVRDGLGTTEQVFVSIAGIRNGRITGRIASDISAVPGIQKREPQQLPEKRGYGLAQPSFRRPRGGQCRWEVPGRVAEDAAAQIANTEPCAEGAGPIQAPEEPGHANEGPSGLSVPPREP